jgi:hypothetical protein
MFFPTCWGNILNNSIFPHASVENFLGSRAHFFPHENNKLGVFRSLYFFRAIAAPFLAYSLSFFSLCSRYRYNVPMQTNGREGWSQSRRQRKNVGRFKYVPFKYFFQSQKSSLQPMSFPVVLKRFIFFYVTSEKLLSVANSKKDYSAGLNHFQTFGKFLIPILKGTLCYKSIQCRKLDIFSRKAITERLNQH